MSIFYRHYKGGLYEKLYTGKHSETLDDLVIYRQLQKTEFPIGYVWVRPRKMFYGKVRIDGRYIKRFTRIVL